MKHKPIFSILVLNVVLVFVKSVLYDVEILLIACYLSKEMNVYINIISNLYAYFISRSQNSQR